MGRRGFWLLIEVSETKSWSKRVIDRVLRRKGAIRSTLVFLKFVPEYMRYTRPLRSPWLLPPTPFERVRTRAIERERERSLSPPRIKDTRAPLISIGIGAGAAGAAGSRQQIPGSHHISAAATAQLPEIGYGSEAASYDEDCYRAGAERDSIDPLSGISIHGTEREKHRDAYVMGRPYDEGYVLEGIPRRYRPMRLDGLVEYDERSGRGWLGSGGEEMREESDAVDELLERWTNVFEDEKGEDMDRGEKDGFDEAGWMGSDRIRVDRDFACLKYLSRSW